MFIHCHQTVWFEAFPQAGPWRLFIGLWLTPLPVDTESKILGDNTIYYRAGDVRNLGIITVFPIDFEIVARDDGGAGDVRWSCDRTGRPLTEAPPATCSTRLLKVNIQFPQ